MKFTTTENYSYRSPGMHVPKPWIDYGLDVEKSIRRYWDREIKILDADTAGYTETDFLFDNGKCYRLYYEWYLNFDHGEDESFIQDTYYIERINVKDADLPAIVERDYL